MDMIIRVVMTGGKEQYLPIVVDDKGVERMRGEFKATPEDALVVCVRMAGRCSDED